MFDNYNDILSVNETMEALDIGRSILYRLLASGQIKAIKVGTRWKIPRKSLEEFVNQRLQINCNIKTFMKNN